jgi:hypothetical protein
VVSIAALPEVGLLLVEVLYDPGGPDDDQEWVRVYNGTDADVDLAGYSLGWGGASYVSGTTQLSGVVPARGCAVVGGPSSTFANGNPSIDLAQDFSPDLENSPSAAGDALGLFHALAADLDAASIPADAVVWGANNATGFVGPGGLPFAAAHVPSGPEGASIVRTSVGSWAINETPSNKPCVPIVQ